MPQRHPALTSRIIEWMFVIRGEFEEAPHLRVTIEEASQLWPVDTDSLTAILDVFVDVGFLHRSPDGAYGRALRVRGDASLCSGAQKP